MTKKTLKDIDVKGKVVFLRVDYNVPLDENRKILDTSRIKATIPTIKYLIKEGAKILLASHLGRPQKIAAEKRSTLSLFPVKKCLEDILAKEINFSSDCIGKETQEKVKKLKEGDILLLENLRFHQGEEKNDAEFAKELASLADIAVNDAFGCAHRGHASNMGITKYLEMVAGPLLEKEIAFMDKVFKNPKRPFVVLVGGAKVSDKIGVLQNLLEKADAIIIGGGMAHTFNASLGHELGKSLFEEDKVKIAGDLLVDAKRKSVEIFLPDDFVVADKFAPDAKTKIVRVNGVKGEWMGLDIGPETIDIYKNEIKKAKTILWNGPMGVAEFPAFSRGTNEMAKAIAKVTEEGATSIVGGGDSISALNKTGLTSKITHVSTGGGATLEYLEGKELPALKALADK